MAGWIADARRRSQIGRLTSAPWIVQLAPPLRVAVASPDSSRFVPEIVTSGAWSSILTAALSVIVPAVSSVTTAAPLPADSSILSGVIVTVCSLELVIVIDCSTSSSSIS
jgi:hypothetical protein